MRLKNTGGKEFLNSVSRSFLLLNCKLEQLACLQDAARKINAVINGTPSVGDKSFSRIESAVTNALQYSQSVADAVTDFIQLHRMAADEISNLPNLDERLILEYRYLAFKSWSEISAIMHISLRYLYKIHGNALESLEKILADGDKRAQKGTKDTLTDSV